MDEITDDGEEEEREADERRGRYDVADSSGAQGAGDGAEDEEKGRAAGEATLARVSKNGRSVRAVLLRRAEALNGITWSCLKGSVAVLSRICLTISGIVCGSASSSLFSSITLCLLCASSSTYGTADDSATRASLNSTTTSTCFSLLSISLLADIMCPGNHPCCTLFGSSNHFPAICTALIVISKR